MIKEVPRITREETVKIIRIMVDSYPNYKPNDISETINVWCMMLDEYSYNDVAMALKSYILSDNSGFPPSIGQLVDKIKDVAVPQELNEMEAWSLVSRAIRNSGYNSAEEFAKFPPLVQKAVGLSDQLRIWALDERYNEGVVRGHFINCYKTLLKREREFQKIPKSVREVIEKTNRTSYVGQIEQKRKEMIESARERKHDEIKVLESKSELSSPPQEKLMEVRRMLENG